MNRRYVVAKASRANPERVYLDPMIATNSNRYDEFKDDPYPMIFDNREDAEVYAERLKPYNLVGFVVVEIMDALKIKPDDCYTVNFELKRVGDTYIVDQLLSDGRRCDLGMGNTLEEAFTNLIIRGLVADD